MIGYQEILIIAFIILLLFGGKKIPEMMKGMGKGVKSFKDGMKGIDESTTSNPGTSDGSKNPEAEESKAGSEK